MKNNSNQSNGMAWMMNKFHDSVYSETCLKLIHRHRHSLPSKCKWRFKSLTSSDSVSFFHLFLPQANAKIQSVENYDEKMKEARWMVVYDGLSYELSLKLDKIPDESFKNRLKISIKSNYEDSLKHKVKNNEVLEPYEEVFMSCGMDYASRMEVVKDFLTKLDLEKDINFWELLYSDPKFWDCIVPYPDKRNIDKVIENSFESNKLFAENINSTWSSESSENIDYTIELDNLISKKVELEDEYNNKMSKFQEKLNSWDFTSSLEEEMDSYKKDFETKNEEITGKISSLMEKINNPTYKQPEKTSIDLEQTKVKENKSSDLEGKAYKNIYFYLVFVLILFVWLFFLFLWIKKKNKKSI